MRVAKHDYALKPQCPLVLGADVSRMSVTYAALNLDDQHASATEMHVALMKYDDMCCADDVAAAIADIEYGLRQLQCKLS